MGDLSPWNDQSRVSIFFRWWWEGDRWQIVFTWSEAAQCAVYISGCQKLDEPLLMKHIDHENYITTFCTFSVNVERLEWPTGRNKQYGPLLKSRRFKSEIGFAPPSPAKSQGIQIMGVNFYSKIFQGPTLHIIVHFLFAKEILCPWFEFLIFLVVMGANPLCLFKSSELYILLQVGTFNLQNWRSFGICNF